MSQRQSSLIRLILSVLPFAKAFVGTVHFDLEIAPSCAEGGTVVLTHPGCRPSPWFPAYLLQSDARNGNATVFYGWSSNDGWTPAAGVPLGRLTSYGCLREEWYVDGERGRGYDYLPSCEAIDCVLGCLVSDSSVCDKTRLELGENCSVPCDQGAVTVLCDALAWPEQRTVECLAKIVYCDELANTTLSNADCVDRNEGTTSTTVPQSERYFKGCAELIPLAGTGSSVVVGMPENQMVSGAYYFEIGVPNGEVAGFIDASWDGETQWLSSSAGSAPGHVGLAVRFLSKETAEIRFSWNGIWENGRQIGFSQYLVAVVLAFESSWRIPADSWLFLPPSVLYGPLTRGRFPDLCHFPLEFESMAQPPVCRDGLRVLGSLEECAEAGFHLGLLAAGEVIAGYFEGFPGECFLCKECDHGDVFWNNATAPADLATQTVRQAPSAAALCRRSPADDQQVENNDTEVFSTPAEFYMGASACPDDYAPIYNASVCEAAAFDLGLGFQTVATVSLPTLPSDGAVLWPAGCFYCPLCEMAHLPL
eukprot:symbB.v1.2.016497.t1/scaffold1254.1/size128712/11